MIISKKQLAKITKTAMTNYQMILTLTWKKINKKGRNLGRKRKRKGTEDQRKSGELWIN